MPIEVRYDPSIALLGQAVSEAGRAAGLAQAAQSYRARDFTDPLAAQFAALNREREQANLRKALASIELQRDLMRYEYGERAAAREAELRMRLAQMGFERQRQLAELEAQRQMEAQAAARQFQAERDKWLEAMARAREEREAGRRTAEAQAEFQRRAGLEELAQLGRERLQAEEFLGRERLAELAAEAEAARDVRLDELTRGRALEDFLRSLQLEELRGQRAQQLQLQELAARAAENLTAREMAQEAAREEARTAEQRDIRRAMLQAALGERGAQSAFLRDILKMGYEDELLSERQARQRQAAFEDTAALERLRSQLSREEQAEREKRQYEFQELLGAAKVAEEQIQEKEAWEKASLEAAEDTVADIVKQLANENLTPEGRQLYSKLLGELRMIQAERMRLRPRQYYEALLQWIKKVDDSRLDAYRIDELPIEQQFQSSAIPAENGTGFFVKNRSGWRFFNTQPRSGAAGPGGAATQISIDQYMRLLEHVEGRLRLRNADKEGPIQPTDEELQAEVQKWLKGYRDLLGVQYGPAPGQTPMVPGQTPTQPEAEEALTPQQALDKARLESYTQAVNNSRQQLNTMFDNLIQEINEGRNPIADEQARKFVVQELERLAWQSDLSPDEAKQVREFVAKIGEATAAQKDAMIAQELGEGSALVALQYLQDVRRRYGSVEEFLKHATLEEKGRVIRALSVINKANERR